MLLQLPPGWPVGPAMTTWDYWMLIAIGPLLVALAFATLGWAPRLAKAGRGDTAQERTEAPGSGPVADLPEAQSQTEDVRARTPEGDLAAR